MVVFSDGETIVLKPLKNSDSDEFKAFCKKAQKFAADTNMTEDDIQTAIKRVAQKLNYENSCRYPQYSQKMTETT